MSVSRLFTVVGDLNIKRNMTGLNVASRETMKSAQVIDCVSMATLDDALNDVRKESTVLVIAAFTEFLLSGGDCGTIASSIDPILAELSTKIKGFCAFRPNLKVRRITLSLITLAHLTLCIFNLVYLELDHYLMVVAIIIINE